LSALSAAKHYINGNIAQVGGILYGAPLSARTCLHKMSRGYANKRFN